MVSYIKAEAGLFIFGKYQMMTTNIKLLRLANEREQKQKKSKLEFLNYMLWISRTNYPYRNLVILIGLLQEITFVSVSIVKITKMST